MAQRLLRKKRDLLWVKFVWLKIKTSITQRYRQIAITFRKKPLTSFFITLGALLLLILLASFLGKPRSTSAVISYTKAVSISQIGTAPRISLPAKIQKSGIIKLVAQTSGIVQDIPVTEGDTVTLGKNVINLASNYQGGNSADVQAQIAKDQNDNVANTYQQQQDLINEQKQVASVSATNTTQLQQIAMQSDQDSQTLIHNDQDIISTLNQELSNYSASNSGGLNDAVILQTQSLISQFQTGINQLNSALRQSQYQQSPLNPPLILNTLQEDVTIKQLEIQQQSLALNKEISALQLNVAYLNASLMHPVSPVNGVVQRVYVTPGEFVNTGTELMVISSNDNNLEVTAIVSVPSQIIQSVSRLENSIVHIGSMKVALLPRYISQEATDGNLYTILYDIPQQYHRNVSDGGYLSIDVPIGLPNTGSTIPYIPIDAVYQTQNDSYVYVVKNQRVVSKSIQLGNVLGSYVQVNAGLSNGDQIILDRTVIAGDLVKAM